MIDSFANLITRAKTYLPLQTNAVDSGSSPQTVTTTGSVTYVAIGGKTGAYFPNSMSTYLTVPFTRPNYATVAFWMYVIDATYYTAVSISSSAWNPTLQFDTTSSTTIGVYSAMPNQWITNSQTYPGTARWVHVAATIDYVSYQVKVYIDGALTSTVSGSGAPSISQTNLVIGRSGDNARAFNGYIRQFAFFESLLTPTQIYVLRGETDFYTYGSSYTLNCATGYSGAALPIVCQSGATWSAQVGCTLDANYCSSAPIQVGYIVATGTQSMGATRTVTCATGYTGTASTITCQATGAWTASSGCTIRNCGTPVASTGYVLGTNYGGTTVGGQYSMTCGTYYSGVSIPGITCQSDGTWSTQSGCSLIADFCPPSPVQANYVFAAGLSTYGAARTATCYTGYSGSASSINCQSDGTWAASSGCSLISCGVPIAGAGYVVGSGSTTYGSTYSMTCATGYSGTAATLTCQITGAWSPQSGCTLVNCAQPAIALGYAQLYGALTYNSIYTMACAPGYTGTAAALTCQASGSWTAVSGCSIGSCSLAPQQHMYTFAAGASTYGSTRTATCSTGFTGTAASILCRADLSWSLSSGCAPVSCGTPTASAGYTVGSNAGGTTYGGVYTMSCAVGYAGTPVNIVCQSGGTWSTQSGCLINSCATPEQPNYVIASGSYTFGSSLSVSCGTGYTGTATSITCNSVSGATQLKWSLSSGCTLRSCGAPVASSGYALGTGSVTYNSVYTMSCATGYSGAAASLRCQADGTWTAQSGCNVLTNYCSTAPTFTGYVIASGAQTIGASRTVSCATGYTGTPAAIACQSGGTWSATSGCTIVDCGSPIGSSAYVIASGSTTYGSTRTVSCSSGYGGVAPALTCQSSGTWSALSGCVLASCGDPGQTGYSYSAGTSNANDERTVSCASGYTGTPSPLTTRCSIPTWSSNTGCTIRSCGTPTASAGYALGSGSTIFGSVYTMQCATGYTGSAASLTCQADGTW